MPLSLDQGPGQTGDLRTPVASFGHTLGLMAIFAVAFAIAFALQTGPGAATAVAGGPASARNLLPGFGESLAFDWGVLYYVWGGVRERGGSLLQLSGRPWSSARDVARDILIAVPFWVLWEATAFAAFTLLNRFVLAPTGPVDDAFPVRGALEITAWIAVSLSAGFCEELIFRGYLQRQFSALTGRRWLGIALQAVMFGLIHPRGWRAVLVISLLGGLYGALAAARGNLRPGILSHGWSDLWEGWLKVGFGW